MIDWDVEQSFPVAGSTRLALSPQSSTLIPYTGGTGLTNKCREVSWRRSVTRQENPALLRYRWLSTRRRRFGSSPVPGGPVSSAPTPAAPWVPPPLSDDDDPV